MVSSPRENLAGSGRPAPRLAGRVALVTGASRGIGAAVACALAGEGAHLILLGRTAGGLEETDDAIRKLAARPGPGSPDKASGEGATLVPLDLDDFDAIDRMVTAIAERFQRLDILIGNAGTLGTLTPVAHGETAMWERVFRLNVLANQRLLRAADPLLRAAPAGRAIFTTSGAAQKHLPFWGAYAAAKAALESMVKTYAAETAKTPVRANLVNPGPTRTRMRAEAFPGEDPDSLPPPDAIVPLFVELALPQCTATGTIINARADGPAATRDA